MELMGSNAQVPMGVACDSYSPPTVTARLKAQKQDLENRLAKVNEALGYLEGNPELQKAFDAISRVS